MLLDEVVTNIDLAVFHAQMLSLFKATFPQTSMDLVMRQQLTNGFQSAYYPANGDYVAAYLVGDNTRKILYLGGMETANQAARLMDGYSVNFGLTQFQSSNIFIRNTMDYYMNLFTLGHMQDTEYLDVVGYSLGGAIATSMMYNLRFTQTNKKMKLFTFGAPRAGGSEIRDQLARSPIARYMTYLDPIPLIPPRLQDSPQLAPFTLPGIFLSWSNMVHTQGGIVLNQDGSTEEAVVPPEAAVSPGIALVDWIFSLELSGGNPHSLDTYIAYLRNAAARRPRPQEKKVDVAPPEVAADLRRVEVNRERDRQVTAVAHAQKAQQAQIAVSPDIVLFKAVRMGRIWTVTFGDKIVAQGVRADTARHLCRAGNDFLKSLPKQGTVDPIGLAAQFENFLAFATAPESEWQPKLRTNLDVG